MLNNVFKHSKRDLESITDQNLGEGLILMPPGYATAEQFFWILSLARNVLLSTHVQAVVWGNAPNIRVFRMTKMAADILKETYRTSTVNDYSSI